MSTQRRLFLIAPRLWRSEAISAPLGIRLAHTVLHRKHGHKIPALRYRRGPNLDSVRFNNGDEILETSRRTTIDVQDVRALLQTSHHKISFLPFEERASAAAKIGAGKVLRWLRTLDERTWAGLLGMGLADVLCWHLEAEQLQASSSSAHAASPVIDWLDHATRYTDQDRPGWPSMILGAHIKALVYWHKNLDFAINVVNRYKGRIHSGSALGHIQEALTCFDKDEPEGQYWTVSEEAFERYLAYPVSDGRRATAMLFHPTRLDPLPFYQLHQPSADKPAGKPKGYRKFSEHTLRAIELLRYDGMAKEAQELAQHYQGMTGVAA